MKKEKEIGSFYIEPVLGSGGVIIPPQKYLDRIQENLQRIERKLSAIGNR